MPEAPRNFHVHLHTNPISAQYAIPFSQLADLPFVAYLSDSRVRARATRYLYQIQHMDARIWFSFSSETESWYSSKFVIKSRTRACILLSIYLQFTHNYRYHRVRKAALDDRRLNRRDGISQHFTSTPKHFLTSRPLSLHIDLSLFFPIFTECWNNAAQSCRDETPRMLERQVSAIKFQSDVRNFPFSHWTWHAPALQYASLALDEHSKLAITSMI